MIIDLIILVNYVKMPNNLSFLAADYTNKSQHKSLSSDCEIVFLKKQLTDEANKQ